MDITLKDLSVVIGSKTILAPVNLTISKGRITTLIGTNGSGKTTLMRALMKNISGISGETSLWALPEKERAKKVGWIDQERNLAWHLSVKEVVALGRTAHKNFLSSDLSGKSAIEKAMEKMQLGELKERSFESLSGGEQARTLIARLLAGEPEIIIADEPIAALDPKNQYEVMEVFKKEARAGKTVLISIHDINLTKAYADDVIIMKNGALLAAGNADEMLTKEKLKETYDIDWVSGTIEDIPVLQPYMKSSEKG